LCRFRAKNRKTSPRATGHKLDGLKEKGLLYHSPDGHMFATGSSREGFLPMPGVGSSLGIAVPRAPVECGPYSSTYPPGPQQQFQPSGQIYQPAGSKYPMDYNRYKIKSNSSQKSSPISSFEGCFLKVKVNF